MSGNRRKNTTNRPVNAEEDPLASRVVAIPKNPEQPKVPPQKQARIGEILRQARLDKKEDLYLIADYLRIKPAFLIALENSKYDEFPADAYIIGFLRTYASFLEVDSKEAVDRYRYEMAGRRKKPALVMPVPVSGGRTPSGVIMVGAVVAALLLYAVWYTISTTSRAEVNVQPQLPTVAQTVTPATNVPAANSAIDGLAAPVVQAASGSATVTPAPTALHTTTPAPVAALPPSSLMPPESPGIIVGSDAPKGETHILDGKNNKDNADASNTKDNSATKDDKAAKDTKDDSDKKQVFGDPNKVSRVIIRATQNSWIMVTDENGKALFDHVMKAGDVYKVPNKSGLSLTTGNANGIDVTIDGQTLTKASSGPGHIVRDIALDPDHATPTTSDTPTD